LPGDGTVYDGEKREDEECQKSAKKALNQRGREDFCAGGIKQIDVWKHQNKKDDDQTEAEYEQR
jgi:hypothetical protein